MNTLRQRVINLITDAMKETQRTHEPSAKLYQACYLLEDLDDLDAEVTDEQYNEIINK